MIVLDASVLIGHLDATDVHHEPATALLLDTADDALGVSPLTLAEVLVGPARLGKLEVARLALRDLEITTIPLVEDAPVRLATLRASTGLRLPDCCVLLAAQPSGQVLATFDHRLAVEAATLGIAVRD